MARPAQLREISTEERIAYQYAIEDVYWRHRIWPKENARPKPFLDEVLSPAQIAKEVQDYLRDSTLLADRWQRPITPEQLQTEIERMASHTKQPDVLQEIFAALGNNPFVIAECLARPILADHLIADLTTHEGGATKHAEGERQTENVPYALPQISVPTDCANDTWAATTIANAPTARWAHTAIWTGTEMIVWGGTDTFSGNTGLNTGGRYNPSTDSWAATSTTSAPSPRRDHTAVWTGTEMIIWGGFDDNTNNFLNTGARYNPSTDSWAATTIANAPTARYIPTAIWSGSEMIVWGGGGNNFTYLNTGGKYSPSTDSWTATSTTSAPIGRNLHTSVWTGTEMIIWGGFNGNTGSFLNTGGRYVPGTDSWTATASNNAPNGRRSHTAVWTGAEMIIWGGFDGSTGLDTGRRYNPGTDTWTATSNINPPNGRYDHTAVWTGSEMIVWGGEVGMFNTGGRYNPNMETWTATTTNNAPIGRTSHTAVWTGSEMIIWGGYDASGTILNTGGRYCAQQQPPLLQDAVSRKTHGAAGTFDVDLPLTGTPGIECRTGGSTNDHAIDVTFSSSVTVNGNPQAAVTAGIGTVGSEGKSNGGMVLINGNIVTVPLTNVANAQTINVTLFGVNGTSNLVIPMSVLVGDVNGNGAVNASDIALTKSRIGQPINETDFRADVSAGGSINATDVSIVKSNIGTALP
jgi:N-acetylneuraminic acid mutarotase